MGETNFDIVVAEGVQVTNGLIVKTVGVGKDFESFHKAMTWACQQVTLNHGQIKLVLDAGTHYVGEPEDFNEDTWCFYTIANNIFIEGAGKATTFITLPSTDDGNNYPGIFWIGGGRFRIQGVTIDGTYGGYPYAKGVDAGFVYRADCAIISCNFSDLDAAFVGGQITYNDSCVIDDCALGVFISGNGIDITLNATTISNCDEAIGYFNSGRNGHISTKNTIFTTNTSDYPFTLNEIQYDGSFISNAAAALTLKA